MQQGQWISLDAILFTSILIIFSISIHSPEPFDTKPLLVLQQQNDLMAIWSTRSSLQIEQMQAEIEWLFPQMGYELQVGEKQIERSGNGKHTSDVHYWHWQANASPTLVSFRLQY